LSWSWSWSWSWDWSWNLARHHPNKEQNEPQPSHNSCKH